MIPRLSERRSETVQLLASIAQELRSGVDLLGQLLGTPTGQRRQIQDQLNQLEGSALDLHFHLLTNIRTVFLTPLPREDIHALSQRLNRVLEHVVAAGDLIVARDRLALPRHSADMLETLGMQADLTVSALARLEDMTNLEDYTIQINRLTKQAQRTYRRWLTSTDGAFQPNIAMQQEQIATVMMHAVEAMREVSTVAGSIIVRES